MHTSRECGAEVSSFTHRTAANWKPASTRMPKASQPAPESPVPQPPGNLAAVAGLARNPVRAKVAPRSDQGACLAAVNGHTCPADPAHLRRHEEPDDGP